MSDLIEIDFNASPELKRIINSLVAKGKDLSQPMREIGNILETSIKYNFEVGGRYSGEGESVAGGSKKWDALELGYYDWKVNKKGKSTTPLTFDSQLLNSIESTNADRTGVDINAPKEYAAAQHFGHEYANFTLPARPFMVMQDEDIEDAFDVLRGHFKDL